MGVIATTNIVGNGRVGAISEFFGNPEGYMGFVNSGTELGTILVTRVDNSATSKINDIELLGSMSGKTFTISVDDFSEFEEVDGGVINFASVVVGSVLMGTYEYLEVVSINAGVPAPITYSVNPEGGVEANYVLADSGLFMSN